MYIIYIVLTIIYLQIKNTGMYSYIQINKFYMTSWNLFHMFLKMYISSVF